MKTTKYSDSEINVARGRAIAQMKLEQLSDDLIKGIRTNKGILSYLGDNNFPDFDEVTGENDLTPREVFLLGSAASITALREAAHTQFGREVDHDLRKAVISVIDDEDDPPVSKKSSRAAKGKALIDKLEEQMKEAGMSLSTRKLVKAELTKKMKASL